MGCPLLYSQNDVVHCAYRIHQVSGTESALNIIYSRLQHADLMYNVLTTHLITKCKLSNQNACRQNITILTDSTVYDHCEVVTVVTFKTLLLHVVRLVRQRPIRHMYILFVYIRYMT